MATYHQQTLKTALPSVHATITLLSSNQYNDYND